MPKVRGSSQEEQPHLQGAAAAGGRRAERSSSTFKVRRGGREKTPLVKGKEQRLRFGGASVIPHIRGNARGHQRADTLKP